MNLRKIFSFRRVTQRPTQSQLVELYRIHRSKACECGDIRPSTMEFQNSVLKNFMMFSSDAGISDQGASDFNAAQLCDFYHWVIRNKKATRAYSAKNVQVIKSMYGWAMSSDLIDINRITGTRFKRGGRKRIHYLEPEQLERLMNHRFYTDRLQQVADLFILQCHTGFSYSDLAEFDPQLHINMEQHRPWICKTRHKTDTLCVLPLFEPAGRIIAKYTELDIHGRKKFSLPIISNQKYNAYLKEVGGMLDLPFELTTHVGRKTFGTIALNKGYSMEAVSKMLGHSSIKTTQDHYAVILNRRIVAEGF